MKKYFLFLVCLLMISLASASAIVGNYSIEKIYGPNSNLMGWINISLEEEPSNSSLTAFSGNISIKDFLDNSLADYDCDPADCGADYSSSTGQQSKSFSLAPLQEKIIGLQISGELDEISSFSLDVASDAGEYEAPQLFIDVLNDGEYEWYPYAASGQFGEENYGCYEYTSSKANITQIEYCEKITLPSFPSLRIGADVVGSGNANFKLSIENDNYYKECSASASGSGKISCGINLTTDEKQDFFVCLMAANPEDEKKYSVYYETDEPCGFSDYYEGEYEFDFSIFAQTEKYDNVGNFELSTAGVQDLSNVNLEEYIEDYIFDDNRYDGNCTNGCIVPVKFISQKQQTIIISGAGLSYTSGISATTNDIYDVTEEAAKINMDFQKLNLEKSKLLTPESYGSKTLRLLLGEEEILEERIEVVAVPVIDAVVPLTLPAAVEVDFYAFVSGANITKYTWDFGDGSEEITTTENRTKHAYNATGNYDLTIKVANNLGVGSRIFSVNVESPYDDINRTLEEKKAELEEIQTQTDSLEGWYKQTIIELLKLDEIESAINAVERKYGVSSRDAEYVEVMKELNEIEVPVLESRRVGGAYVPNEDFIDPAYLVELGYAQSNPEIYKGSIAQWINENLDINIDGKVYNAVYDDRTEGLASVFALKIHPKIEISFTTHLIIDKNYSDMVFKEDYQERLVKEAVAINFAELNPEEEKIIEFMVQEAIDITKFPAYVSPKFSELPPPNETVTPCDYDKICEKNLDENSDNCPSDCIPIGKIWKRRIFWLIILLICAFIVYIAMQEWYKRYYEKHLFKDRRDLFNLVWFVSNAENQKLTRGDIREKLKEYGWTGEQITYAYKKANGKRTGMWEIPVFKWLEKKQVKKEIAKRQVVPLHIPKPQELQRPDFRLRAKF